MLHVFMQRELNKNGVLATVVAIMNLFLEVPLNWGIINVCVYIPKSGFWDVPKVLVFYESICK